LLVWSYPQPGARPMPPRRSRTTIVPEPVSPWLVRKVKGSDGSPLARPRLWGKVWASSEQSAIAKFVFMVGAQSSAPFDAVPFSEGRVA
jgi:hypothetical protein